MGIAQAWILPSAPAWTQRGKTARRGSEGRCCGQLCLSDVRQGGGGEMMTCVALTLIIITSSYCGNLLPVFGVTLSTKKLRSVVVPSPLPSSFPPQRYSRLLWAACSSSSIPRNRLPPQSTRCRREPLQEAAAGPGPVPWTSRYPVSEAY